MLLRGGKSKRLFVIRYGVNATSSLIHDPQSKIHDPYTSAPLCDLGGLAVNLSSKNRRREAASPYWVGIMEQDDPWTDWDKMSQLR
jgi:hypothetical protein